MSKKWFLFFVGYLLMLVLTGCNENLIFSPATVIPDRVQVERGFAETYTAFSSRFSDLLRSNELEMSNASSAKHIIRNNNFKTSRLSHQVGEWTTYYSVGVHWEGYSGASGYRIYHSINGKPFTLACNWPLEPGEYSPGGYGYSEDYAPGSTYSYYVVAYGSDWETTPSEIVNAPTHFLPPIFLKSPINGSTVSGLPMVFQWEISNLHPLIAETTGILIETAVHVLDSVTLKCNIVFETYGFTEQATCGDVLESILKSGQEYKWYVEMGGQDSAGNYINSNSDVWTFNYQK